MSSAFSGSAGRKAAVWAAGYLEDQQNKINDLIGQGEAKSVGAIGTGTKSAISSLQNSYNDAIGYYSPYATTGANAFNQYADATGVNGQTGYDRAVGNFHASPGYQYQVDQASDQVARQASALGTLGSGNTMAAISDRAQNLADQDYGSYLDRLNGIGQMGYNATGQQAGLRSQQGSAIANAKTNKMSLLNGVYQNSTGLGVNSLANTGNQIAQLGYNGMMAGQQAAATRMNFGLGALGTGLNLLSLGTGGGNTIGGSLFSKITG